MNCFHESFQITCSSTVWLTFTTVTQCGIIFFRGINYLFSNFLRHVLLVSSNEYVAFTKFLLKKCEIKFPYLQAVSDKEFTLGQEFYILSRHALQLQIAIDFNLRRCYLHKFLLCISLILRSPESVRMPFSGKFSVTFANISLW